EREGASPPAPRGYRSRRPARRTPLCWPPAHRGTGPGGCPDTAGTGRAGTAPGRGSSWARGGRWRPGAGGQAGPGPAAGGCRRRTRPGQAVGPAGAAGGGAPGAGRRWPRTPAAAGPAGGSGAGGWGHAPPGSPNPRPHDPAAPGSPGRSTWGGGAVRPGDAGAVPAAPPPARRTWKRLGRGGGQSTGAAGPPRTRGPGTAPGTRLPAGPDRPPGTWGDGTWPTPPARRGTDVRTQRCPAHAGLTPGHELHGEPWPPGGSTSAPAEGGVPGQPGTSGTHRGTGERGCGRQAPGPRPRLGSSPGQPPPPWWLQPWPGPGATGPPGSAPPPAPRGSWPPPSSAETSWSSAPTPDGAVGDPGGPGSQGRGGAVDADEVAGTEAAHGDTERAEAQGADGKMAGPPGAGGQEDEEVDAGEGGDCGVPGRQGAGGLPGLTKGVGRPQGGAPRPSPEGGKGQARRRGEQGTKAQPRRARGIEGPCVPPGTNGASQPRAGRAPSPRNGSGGRAGSDAGQDPGCAGLRGRRAQPSPPAGAGPRDPGAGTGGPRQWPRVPWARAGRPWLRGGVCAPAARGGQDSGRGRFPRRRTPLPRARGRVSYSLPPEAAGLGIPAPGRLPGGPNRGDPASAGPSPPAPWPCRGKPGSTREAPVGAHGPPEAPLLAPRVAPCSGPPMPGDRLGTPWGRPHGTAGPEAASARLPGSSYTRKPVGPGGAPGRRGPHRLPGTGGSPGSPNPPGFSTSLFLKGVRGRTEGRQGSLPTRPPPRPGPACPHGPWQERGAGEGEGRALWEPCPRRSPCSPL
uniref:Uncharacterized protein n=1 Tax=Mustela putorius furo TaxID=9669 RepID=M3Y9H2_MUSPF